MQFVLQQFPGITSLLYTINTKRNDSLHDLEPVVYHGKGYVIEKLENFQFKIGPKSFSRPIHARARSYTELPVILRS
ncbi:hypothetical protein KRR40_18380 [Niabella defluvii]|nr:hypothetical protein KRR40_18380 [Niabella sp. I65]